MLIYAVLLPLALSRLVHGMISVGDFLLVTTLMIQLIRNVFDIANGLPDTYDMIGSIRDSLDMLIVPREIRDEPAAGRAGRARAARSCSTTSPSRTIPRSRSSRG